MWSYKGSNKHLFERKTHGENIAQGPQEQLQLEHFVLEYEFNK